MNHLIEGCEIAIKKGLPEPSSATKYFRTINEEYKDNLKKVLAHYENGGDIFTRP